MHYIIKETNGPLNHNSNNVLKENLSPANDDDDDGVDRKNVDLSQ